ncbi:MAG: hypothetical protein ACM3TN_12400 [Alphaproteobacteria bacterium]
MRLQDFASFFRRDEFAAMTAAYDAAWQHLRFHKPELTDNQAKNLKRKLAQIILASACNGIRDVVRLKEIALRAVSGRALHRLGMLASHVLPATLFAT